VFFIVVAVLTSVALLILAVKMPETPSFCLMIGDVEGYKKSLLILTGISVD
jgi:hypothetical protein